MSYLDKPNFWIKRLKSKPNGLSLDLNHKWTELIEKIENGSPLEQEVTKCLMKKYSRYSLWHKSEQGGMTPMHIAAAYGLIDVVKFIASYNINPNAPKINGWTPVHAAAQHGHIEIVKVLTSIVENPNKPAMPSGWTPIH